MSQFQKELQCKTTTKRVKDGITCPDGGNNKRVYGRRGEVDNDVIQEIVLNFWSPKLKKCPLRIIKLYESFEKSNRLVEISFPKDHHLHSITLLFFLSVPL